MSDLDRALIEEAMKKSGLVWIDVEGLTQPHAAWHVWHEGSAYVVVASLQDEVEQPLTELAISERATVIARSKTTGSRLVSWIADVDRVRPGSAEWQAVTPLLAKDRLNAPDGEAQTDRWAQTAYIMRLTPTGQVTETPGNMPDTPQYAQPLDTPATRTHHRPFMIGAKRRRPDR